MKRILIIIAILLMTGNVFAGVKIKNPYINGGGFWHMGNPHSHSNNSDGTPTPAELLAAYDAINYSWLVSTDHFGNSPNYPAGDDAWTADPTGGTALWVAGAEHGWGEGHFIIVGGSRVTPGDTTTLNAEINAANDSDSNGVIDGVIILAHPVNATTAYRPDSWTNIDVSNGISYVAASAIEIGNSNSSAEAAPINMFTGYIGGATNSYLYRYSAAFRHWDSMRELWGIGGDDTHGVAAGDKYPTGEYGGFSTVVQTSNAAINLADLQAAIDSGNMYVRENAWITTHHLGAAISSITVTSGVITVNFASSVNVTWYKRGLQSIKTETGVTTTTYTPDGTEGWVLCEGIDATVLADHSVSLHTWTQPFFVMEDTDIASGDTVTVSAGATAANITDGNEATTWDSGAAPDATTWFKVDLGSNQLINGVEIVWGTADKFNYKIEFSEDDVTYYVFRHLTFRNDATTTFNIGDANARYIRVTASNYSQNNGGNVVVKECRVYNAPNMVVFNQYLNLASGADANIGSAASPFKTYANASKWTRPRDRLILQDNGVAQTMQEDTYFGRHTYAPRIFSGSYGGVKNNVKSLVLRTHYLTYEDFTVSGSQKYPIYIDGSTSYASGQLAKGITIQRNIVSGANDEASARLVFAIGGSSLSVINLKIQYNLIYDIDNPNNPVAGIRILTTKGPVELYNNTVYLDRPGNTANEACNIDVPAGSSITAINNIFWSDASDATHNLAVNSGTISNNIYGTSGAKAGSWPAITGWAIDPLFLATGSSFRLQGTSPAINAGATVSGLTSDLVGNSIFGATDIGCYEYGGNQSLGTGPAITLGTGAALTLN